MDWFLYDNGLRLERIKDFFSKYEQIRRIIKKIINDKLHFFYALINVVLSLLVLISFSALSQRSIGAHSNIYDGAFYENS